MSEEYKPIRITLSQEAFDRLEQIMKDASFRSYSSTIEECIRVVHDTREDVQGVIGERGDPGKPFTDAQAAYAFKIIATRMSRITGRNIRLATNE